MSVEGAAVRAAMMCLVAAREGIYRQDEAVPDEAERFATGPAGAGLQEHTAGEQSGSDPNDRFGKAGRAEMLAKNLHGIIARELGETTKPSGLVSIPLTVEERLSHSPVGGSVYWLYGIMRQSESVGILPVRCSFAEYEVGVDRVVELVVSAAEATSPADEMTERRFIDAMREIAERQKKIVEKLAEAKPGGLEGSAGRSIAPSLPINGDGAIADAAEEMEVARPPVVGQPSSATPVIPPARNAEEDEEEARRIEQENRARWLREQLLKRELWKGDDGQVVLRLALTGWREPAEDQLRAKLKPQQKNWCRCFGEMPSPLEGEGWVITPYSTFRWRQSSVALRLARFQRLRLKFYWREWCERLRNASP